MKMMIINRTRSAITLIHSYIIDFANTGIVHEDIDDLFELSKIVDNGMIKIIVDFK